MVCDRARPGYCKPGPELQRQRDEEQRQRLGELEASRARRAKAEHEYADAKRKFSAYLRAGARARTTTNARHDDRRAVHCEPRIMWGAMASICSGDTARPSDYVYDMKRVPSPQHPLGQPPAPAQRAPAQHAQQALRRVPRVVRDYVQNLSQQIENSNWSEADKDKAMADMREKLRLLEPKYDTSNLRESYLRGPNDLHYRLKQELREPNSTGSSEPTATQPARNQPAAGTAATTPTVAPGDTGTPAGTPERAAVPGEVACSFLLTMETDREGIDGQLNRLGVQVPQWCRLYLMSIGRDVDQRPPPDVRRQGISANNADEIKLAAEKFKSLFPPGLTD